EIPFERYPSGTVRTVLVVLGFGVGFYWLFGRGLGPTINALSWSRVSTDTHGKARPATAGELRRARLMPPPVNAIYVGRFLDNGQAGESVGYSGGEPRMSIGRTGSGKATGLISPNLSTLRRSILIIDPKGEAAAITARKRAALGRVVMLNPFNLFVEDRPWM